MPLSQDYLQGMISQPVVQPELVGKPSSKNLRIDGALYRQAQETIGMSSTDQTALASKKIAAHVEELTTTPANYAGKVSAAQGAVVDGTVHQIIIEVDADSVELDLDDATPEQQLTAVVKNEKGEVLPYPVVWDSDSDAVATVTSNGLVEAVAVGETTVTATYGGVTVSVPVTVVDTGE